jgi:protein-disulfide isomerase
MIRLFPRALLSLALLATPALASDLTDLGTAERAALRAEMRAYLMENPEVILEAIQVLEQRQASAEASADADLIAAHARALFQDDQSWVGGNPDGDITMVEFMDYRCGYCRKAAPEVESLLKSDGNIRLIIKEFPILGDASLQTSRFAIATLQLAGDEAYAQVHDALIAYKGDVNDTTLRRIGEELGLDADAIIARMDTPEVNDVIAANHALARALNISGTPSFVVGDEMLRGFLPADQMALLIADIRAGN